MAKRTIDNCISQVRALLNDETAPYRYSTDDLVEYFNTALYELKRLRPDVWLGSYGSDLTLYTSADTSSVIPFAEMFFQPVVYFITAQAELRDDEFTQDGRTAMLLQAFAAQVAGPTAGVAR